MTTQSDPLEVPAREGPDRLNYVQGTLLDSQDFTAEQNYHRGRLKRGLEYLFGPGTVAGLDILWRDGEQEIAVTPGLAIDPLGRLIEVPRQQCIRIREWFAAQRPEDLRDGWLEEFGQAVLIADIFIRYRVIPQGKTQAFASGAFDALNAVSPSRLRDDFELGLVIREEAGLRRESLSLGTPQVIPVPDADEILLGIPAGDVSQVHDRILTLWRDEATAWVDGRPPRLSEHLQPRVQLSADDQTQIGRDTTSLMLGRLAITIAKPTTADGVPADLLEKPQFDGSATIPQYRGGKFTRRFVYALGHLTRPIPPPSGGP
jgi:hypothetical protein